MRSGIIATMRQQTCGVSFVRSNRGNGSLTLAASACAYSVRLSAFSLFDFFFSGDDNVRTRGTPWPSRAASAARALVLLGQSIGAGVARSAPRGGEL